MHNESFTQFEIYVLEQLHKSSEKNIPFLPFSSEKIKEMYFMAYRFYRDKHYAEASEFFRFLTVAAPLELTYWKGLGASLQMTKDYEQALRCYQSAQILNKKQPDPYLYVYAADCYFALGKSEQALSVLNTAKLIAEEQEDHKVLNHVDLMQKLWSNKDNKS